MNAREREMPMLGKLTKSLWRGRRLRLALFSLVMQFIAGDCRNQSEQCVALER